MVQAFPSLQAVPFVTATFEHLNPVEALHMSTVHGLWSSQVEGQVGAPPVPDPAVPPRPPAPAAPPAPPLPAAPPVPVVPPVPVGGQTGELDTALT